MKPSYTMVYSVGRIRAAQADQLWFPGNLRNRQGIILTHGYGAADQFANGSKSQSPTLAARLASSGFPCMAGAMSNDSYGNDLSMADMTAAYNYLIAAGLTVANSKVHLVGVSMGNALNVRWAKENPTKVASITGILPLSDITYAYVNNTAGLRGAIEAAWGVAFPADLPANANLLAHAAIIKAAGIPSRLYYSPVDAVVPLTTVETLGIAMGSELVPYDPQAFGHTEAGIGSIGLYKSTDSYRWQDLIKFLRKNGA